jgi:hypothetical protein
MKNFYKGLLLIAYSSFSIQAFSQTDTTKVISVHSHIHHISNLNFKDQDYQIELWLYMISEDTIPDDYINQFAVKESKDAEFSFISLYEKNSVRRLRHFENSTSKDTTTGSRYRRILKIKSTMIQNWHLERYPFDSQYLSITVYRVRPYHWIMLRPMPSNITYSDNKEKHWKIENGWYSYSDSVYQDTVENVFDNERNERYSALRYDIVIKRENKGWIFFKLAVGMYVAFLVAFISLFIPIHELEPRFGLPVGGLFASIANKYIIESSLPQSSQFFLIDKLHSVAILSILLVIIYSTVLQFIIVKHQHIASNYSSSGLKNKKNSEKQTSLSSIELKVRRLDVFVIIIFFSVYLISNVLIIIWG